MSFFGFDQPNSLEDEKRKFLEEGLQGPQQDDLAVYTWGEESYDGLGDALHERGDELNDETFGGTDKVGKDFDFGGQALPTEGLPQGIRLAAQPPSHPQTQPRLQERSRHPEQQQTSSRADLGAPSATTSSHTARSLEALWDDRSPFSALPKPNGGAHPVERMHAQVAAPTFSPFDVEDSLPNQQQQPISVGLGVNQARTLEEIEAEMREAFAAQQISSASPSQTLSQAQLRNTNAHRQHGWQHGQTSTPPPRMYVQQHSQSPRFQQQQQQQQQQQHQQQLNAQLLQQQQLQQLQQLELQERQQHRLLEMQEKLRLEEIERQRQHQIQLRQQAQLNAQYLHHQRQVSGGTPVDSMRYPPQRHRSTTPSRIAQQQQQQPDAPFQQSLQYLPRDIQMQQRLLAEMAQAEFLHSLQNSPVKELGEDKEVQEMLRAEAMRKIMEAERMEEKRRRKLEKIRHMSRYNDLMTQSDKDFITRIQVSQLVTQDPYADDFYAQVYGAIMRSRMGLNAPEALLRFGSGGGVGLGLAQVKGASRRPSAMQRMEQQVERIVNNARLREKEKISLNSLQGALGKTAGRSYKAAPRQLLQVDPNANGGPGGSPTLSHASAHISKADASHPATSSEGEGAARAAAMMGKEALGITADTNGIVSKDPLTHREALIILERLYDLVIEAEAIKQNAPPQDGEEEEDVDAYRQWEEEYTTVVDKLWDGLQVMVPLETSNPHPFVSLITPIKGKRMLPRVTRNFDTQRLSTVLTLLVACFSQLDVVRDAQLLDHLNDGRERRDLEMQTQAFLAGVMQSILSVAATGNLRLINGLLGLFLERNDVGIVARTGPGVALLTMLVSRVETIRQELASSMDPQDMPSAEESQQWQLVFDHLFQLLTPHFLFMFPSVRQAMASNIPLANVPDSDEIDQPVWQFLATLALHTSVEQQQILVTSLRERVLESVATATKNWVADEEQRRLRLANVNIFLHALGLDSSQISL